MLSQEEVHPRLRRAALIASTIKRHSRRVW
jgi:hypothetical protein